MPNLTSMLNSQIYILNPTQQATLAEGSFFHTVTCLVAGASAVKAVGFKAISGSLTGGATEIDGISNRASNFVEAGDYGYTQGLSGKLIENDKWLSSSVTGTFTANQSGATAGGEDSTITVTRAGVDVTSSVTAPTFDGIITNGSGVIDAPLNALYTGAIKPTDTVGADLQVGDVLTFEVMKNGSSIGSATMTLEKDDIDLNAGVYELLGGDNGSIPGPIIAGQTITGRFSHVFSMAGTLIAYK